MHWWMTIQSILHQMMSISLYMNQYLSFYCILYDGILANIDSYRTISMSSDAELTVLPFINAPSYYYWCCISNSILRLPFSHSLLMYRNQNGKRESNKKCLNDNMVYDMKRRINNDINDNIIPYSHSPGQLTGK